MKPIYQSSRSFSTDLYDRLKDGNNHIICLSQDATKTFILAAAIRNQAHLLHREYGSKATIIIEPEANYADERQRMLSDHTELIIDNLFHPNIKQNGLSQVAIMSMEQALSNTVDKGRVNLVILDYSHLLVSQNMKLVQDIVNHFHGIQILAFMCSLIHNDSELTVTNVKKLIAHLEVMFRAKCETSSDLISISRQSHSIVMEVIESNPSEMVICDWILLADSILKDFCELLTDSKLDNIENLLKPGESCDFEIVHNDQSKLTIKKQLVLVRSCMNDILYSMHCLGLWCAKCTVRLYLGEFLRLLQNDTKVGDLISAATTILNSAYGRLDDLVKRFSSDDKSWPLETCGAQLNSLLNSMKEFKPSAGSSLPICIVHVRRRVIAKVIALWLHKIADEHEEYSFIKSNYVVGSTRKHRNRLAVDNFDLQREAAIRDFRFGVCNALIISAPGERCSDISRCNLVISFDVPATFSDFITAKGNCRYDSSKYVIFINKRLEPQASDRLLNYINLERLLTDPYQEIPSLKVQEALIFESLESSIEPYPKNSKNPATIRRAMSIINKYCAKLPSDSFTKLSPEWNIVELKVDEGYRCHVRLPINSPVRQEIVGRPAITKNVAIKVAAFIACKVLHKAGELDDDMMPITKESMRSTIAPNRFSSQPKVKGQSFQKGQAMGSIKRRQYYKKRIAQVFSGPIVSDKEICNLYKFEMTLTCPIPEEQNRRGRRVVDPSETNRNYAIVCTTELPKVCSFPVFTRSGEISISVKLVKQHFTLDKQQVQNLRTFHEFTFSKVLKLQKYPTTYDPDNSRYTVLMAPVVDSSGNTEIDWQFVTKIVNSSEESYTPSIEERKKFQFNYDNYVDAVVIPWYRMDRQQIAYYVAEICTNLNPASPFPDSSSDYETFIDYYRSKYHLEIFNFDQPVLDVDHTSARLNLLTPRYVNRKGKTLPSSTSKSRRESRESLVQKQLLIPELCSIHPFPASFWRKAVCLPCIFHRLNSLFLAEELRRKVAKDTNVGLIEPPEDFEWPPLSFGWSLKGAATDHWIDENTIIESEDDDDNEDEDLDDEDDEDDDINHPVWNDEKVHNQPLLKELFVPTHRPVDETASSELSKFRKVLQIDSNVDDDLDDSKMTKFLDKKVDNGNVKQILISILNDTFEKKIPFCQDDVDESLIEWYELMRKLSNKVDEALSRDPEMFKDNEIDLVSVDDCNLSNQPTFGELLPNRDVSHRWTVDEWKNIKFDPTLRELKSIGPSPSVILQSLTMSNASDGINLERLETVGDSFLKYSITAYLYCTHGTMHEGKLSFMRSGEISNSNLYQLGYKKNLGEIMSATKFEPNDNWLPPGYTVARIPDSEKMGDCKRREIDRALADVPYDLLLDHSIPDKSIADCVEALIGAYLTTSGSRAALLFMMWLGLKVMPSNYNIETDLTQYNENNLDSIWRWLETPPSPLICTPPSYDTADEPDELVDEQELRKASLNELHRLYCASNLEKFEQEIGYTFKDKAYLVQAFTHNSFKENHVTDCHQRLEFLGDALLDYLITRYLFEDPRCHSPGALTDLRSALVNNTFFASLAVKYKFHKYLRYSSDELFHVIDGFVKKFGVDSRETTITKGYNLLINEGESEYAEDTEVPKALGDVFESVAGAIFLDSGLSLDQVWRVYFKMMKPEIEHFSSNVPKSPIRELLESKPQNVRFGPSDQAPDKRHRVVVEVFGLGRFTGVGRSKHSAKSTAAKRALRAIAKNEKIKTVNF